MLTVVRRGGLQHFDPERCVLNYCWPFNFSILRATSVFRGRAPPRNRFTDTENPSGPPCRRAIGTKWNCWPPISNGSSWPRRLRGKIFSFPPNSPLARLGGDPGRWLTVGRRLFGFQTGRAKLRGNRSETDRQQVAGRRVHHRRQGVRDAGAPDQGTEGRGLRPRRCVPSAVPS